MSIALMTKVWESELPTHTHKFILLAFADHASDDGLCWPSVTRIARRSQLSRRQTQRIITDLKKLGVLALLEGHKHHQTPLYKLRGDKLTPLPSSEVTSGRSEVTSGRSEVTSATSGVTPTSPPLHISEPSLRTITREPSSNHPDFLFANRRTTA
ncbi:hypothetical protein LCGC14_1798610 [marine sediment metagenome]|uniref:Helix-turn-helix domain-containing protein n=1 Tax=marine sediment metagenome TaxID=412755 RepID=A0A0F9JPW4_9ZZZZ